MNSISLVTQPKLTKRIVSPRPERSIFGDGKAVPMSPTAESAKTKLKELDPEKAKEIPEPAPEPPPTGGMPFGQ